MGLSDLVFEDMVDAKFCVYRSGMASGSGMEFENERIIDRRG